MTTKCFSEFLLTGYFLFESAVMGIGAAAALDVCNFQIDYRNRRKHENCPRSDTPIYFIGITAALVGAPRTGVSALMNGVFFVSFLIGSTLIPANADNSAVSDIFLLLVYCVGSTTVHFLRERQQREQFEGLATTLALQHRSKREAAQLELFISELVPRRLHARFESTDFLQDLSDHAAAIYVDVQNVFLQNLSMLPMHAAEAIGGHSAHIAVLANLFRLDVLQSFGDTQLLVCNLLQPEDYAAELALSFSLAAVQQSRLDVRCSVGYGTLSGNILSENFFTYYTFGPAKANALQNICAADARDVVLDLATYNYLLPLSYTIVLESADGQEDVYKVSEKQNGRVPEEFRAFIFPEEEEEEEELKGVAEADLLPGAVPPSSTTTNSRKESLSSSPTSQLHTIVSFGLKAGRRESISSSTPSTSTLREASFSTEVVCCCSLVFSNPAHEAAFREFVAQSNRKSIFLSSLVIGAYLMTSLFTVIGERINYERAFGTATTIALVLHVIIVLCLTVCGYVRYRKPMSSGAFSVIMAAAAIAAPVAMQLTRPSTSGDTVLIGAGFILSLSILYMGLRFAQFLITMLLMVTATFCVSFLYLPTVTPAYIFMPLLLQGCVIQLAYIMEREQRVLFQRTKAASAALRETQQLQTVRTAIIHLQIPSPLVPFAMGGRARQKEELRPEIWMQNECVTFLVQPVGEVSSFKAVFATISSYFSSHKDEQLSGSLHLVKVSANGILVAGPVTRPRQDSLESEVHRACVSLQSLWGLLLQRCSGEFTGVSHLSLGVNVLQFNDYAKFELGGPAVSEARMLLQGAPSHGVFATEALATRLEQSLKDSELAMATVSADCQVQLLDAQRWRIRGGGVKSVKPVILQDKNPLTAPARPEAPL